MVSLVIMTIAFATLLFFTLVLKKNLLQSSAIALQAAVILYTLLVGFKGMVLLQACLHGLLTTAEISLLVFGALAFFNYLKSGDFIQKLEQGAKRFSTNKLIVTILLALFFGGFIEGISGFGTPAMIVAPLLLALRFPPYQAAVLPLLANTTPVLFGAVGTPVKIGFADLPVGGLPVNATLLMLLPLMALPLFFKRFLTKGNVLTSTDSDVKNSWISISAGIAFAIPFVSLSFLGPEFPTILASITGLLLWLTFIRQIKPSDSTINATTLSQFLTTFRPYLFVAILLIVGKIVLQNNKFTIEWHSIQLHKNIAFFQPGLFFIAGIFVLYFSSRQKHSVSLKSIFIQTLSKLIPIVGTIACLAILAKLLSQNMDITVLFGSATALPEVVYYIAAIITGILGSFMTGSATVSNLLFGTQWYQIGLHYQLPLSFLLACQLAGAAIGNALSLQNIVMVQAVLNESDLDKVIIRKIWRAVLLLVMLIAIAAVIIQSLI